MTDQQAYWRKDTPHWSEEVEHAAGEGSHCGRVAEHHLDILPELRVAWKQNRRTNHGNRTEE